MTLHKKYNGYSSGGNLHFWRHSLQDWNDRPFEVLVSVTDVKEKLLL